MEHLEELMMDDASEEEEAFAAEPLTPGEVLVAAKSLARVPPTHVVISTEDRSSQITAARMLELLAQDAPLARLFVRSMFSALSEGFARGALPGNIQPLNGSSKALDEANALLKASIKRERSDG